jgi:tripartite-type tricarboxylate transporter receptor subunit TctC
MTPTAKRLLAPLALCLAAAIGNAHAQTAWPSQPLKFVVSQSAGGSIDIAARLIGQKLGEALGKPVVIDNRAGANGMIAGEAVARANDGHTFLMTSPLSRLKAQSWNLGYQGLP